MISKLFSKLRDATYRRAFVASQISIGIPFQIRGLMKSRGWKQSELAERTGMLQPRISAMLKPGKTKPNVETLRRIAEAFDCALMVRFVPFSELVNWSERFNADFFDVPSFNHEFAQLGPGAIASEFKDSTNTVGGRNVLAAAQPLGKALTGDPPFSLDPISAKQGKPLSSISDLKLAGFVDSGANYGNRQGHSAAA